MLYKYLQTDNSKATILIRLMVGAVFFSEGIQKFLYPEMRGVGRFEGMVFPNPEFFAGFVGVFEILAGAFLLAGLLTRGGRIGYADKYDRSHYCNKNPHCPWRKFWAVCAPRT